MMTLKNRIPTFQQISAVLGVISFIVYGWTLRQFFWRLPSWKFSYGTGEILTILAYSLATNLLESLTILSAPLLLSIILPGKWFKETFVSKASVMVILGLGYIIYLSGYLSANIDNNYPSWLIRVSSIAGVSIFCLAFLSDRVFFLRKILEEIADRSTIFSYIFLPAGLISLFIVILRNIF